MDIIKFTFSGEELPVSFPFEALVDIQGDKPLSDYLVSYTSIKNQLEVLRIGLKYAGVEKTHTEIRDLAQKNPRTLFKVFKAYEKEAEIFFNGYFDIPDKGDQKKDSQEDESGKIGALDQ